MATTKTSVSLDRRTLAKLRDEARAQHLSVSSLLDSWLRELVRDYAARNGEHESPEFGRVKTAEGTRRTR